MPVRGMMAKLLLAANALLHPQATRLYALAARPQEGRNTLETETSDYVVSSQAEVELLEAGVSEAKATLDMPPESSSPNETRAATDVNSSSELQGALEDASSASSVSEKRVLNLRSEEKYVPVFTFTIKGAFRPDTAAGFVIQGDVELHGNGAVIECQSDSAQAGLALWNAAGKSGMTVVVKDLTIRNCPVGLFLPRNVTNATVTLSNVTITECGQKQQHDASSAVVVMSSKSSLLVQQSKLFNNSGRGVLVMEEAIDSSITLQQTSVASSLQVGVEVRSSQSSLVLKDSTVEDNVESGVVVTDSENVKFTCLGCVIQKNGHYGIFFHETRGAVINFTESIVMDHPESGVMLMDCETSNLTVSSSGFIANGISGITVKGMKEANAMIRDSYFRRNLLAAFRLLGSSTVVTSITNMTAEQNEGSAVILQGKDLHLNLSRSSFSGNMGVGLVIDVTDASRPTRISSCAFEGNGRGMMLTAKSAMVIGQDLNFSKNGQALTLLNETVVELSHCRFVSNVVGVQTYGTSQLHLQHAVLSRSHIGMLGRDKSQLQVINAKIAQNWEGIELREASTVKLKDSIITDNEDGVIAKGDSTVKFTLNAQRERNLVYLNGGIDVGCGDDIVLQRKARRGLLRTLFFSAVEKTECAEYDTRDWSVILRMHHAKFTAALWWYLLALIVFFNLPVVLDPDTDSVWRYPTISCKLSILLAVCALLASTMLVFFLVFGLRDLLSKDTLRYTAAQRAEYTATPWQFIRNTLCWYCLGVSMSATFRWSLERAKRVKRTPEAAIGNLEEEALQRKQCLFAQLDRYIEALAEHENEWPEMLAGDNEQGQVADAVDS